MGCANSSSTKNADNILMLYVSEIKQMASDGMGNKTSAEIEAKLREKVTKILEIAKKQSTIKPTVFYELICSLDDISLSCPDAASKLTTLSNAAKRVVRLRCTGIPSDTPHNDERKVPDYEPSVHVVQRVIPNSASASIFNDREVPIKRTVKGTLPVEGEGDEGDDAVSENKVLKDRKLLKMNQNNPDASSHESDYGFYDFSLHGSMASASIHGSNGDLPRAGLDLRAHG
eukprot:gene11514-24079_t